MNLTDHDRRPQAPITLGAPPPPVDRDTFCRWPETQEGRHEWVNGQIASIAGGSRDHAQITMRVAASLHYALNQDHYQVSTASFGVSTRSGIRYPDVMVDPARRDGLERTTDAPIFIAEILSPSSIAVDMIEKAAEYTAIDSLACYAVFSQDEPRLWAWQRAEAGWPERPEMVAGFEATLPIPALTVTLSLRDIYRGMDEKAASLRP